MATEKESSLSINEFRGINRNVDPEKMDPRHLWLARNLWEKDLGVLETRYGSEDFKSQFTNPWPSNVKKLMSNTKLYKPSGDVRIVAAQCEPDIGGDLPSFGPAEPKVLPSEISLSFVNDENGYWGDDTVIETVEYSGTPSSLAIRLVGYGVDQIFVYTTAGITGYSGAAKQKLRVVISAALNENITGFEIYAQVSHSATDASIGSAWMWCGYQELINTATGTFDFLHVPLGQTGTDGPTTGLEIGENKRTFVATGEATGGSLKGGKTYWVGVLPHNIKFSAEGHSCYRGSANRNSPIDIKPITIPGTGSVGSIEVYTIDPDSLTFMVMIGESPELMQPYGIYNQSGSFTSGNPIVIEDEPLGSPALIDILPSSLTESYFQFRMSDFSHRDILVGINDDATIYPIFMSRNVEGVNRWNDRGPTGLVGAHYSLAYFSLIIFEEINSLIRPGDGSRYDFKQIQDKMFFVNDYDPTAFAKDSSTTYSLVHRTQSNYLMTDGKIAGSVITEFQGLPVIPEVTTASSATSGGLTASTTYHLRVVAEVNGVPVAATAIKSQATSVGHTSIDVTMPSTEGFSYVIYFGAEPNNLRRFPPSALVTHAPDDVVNVWSTILAGVYLEENVVTLPLSKYIADFEGSIVLGGGEQTIDPANKLPRSSLYDFYYSRAGNPYNFTIPGAGSAVLQAIRASGSGDKITGLAIYSNTSGDQGPFSQLLIAKKTSCSLISSLAQPSQNVLSGRVGVVNHFCTVNTEIGTITVAPDNVYLLRDNGEPSPIGQEIQDILKDADFTNAFASYHDKHFKLSFRHPDFEGFDDGLGNNVEFWLNVNKQIEGKGQPDWVGPMTGRSVQYCFVEDAASDNLTYNLSRDRFVIDGNEVRLYKADVVPDVCATHIYDFEELVESEIETKDHEMGEEQSGWNKLIKRIYWKIRTNILKNNKIDIFHKLWCDGDIYEDVVHSWWANSDAPFRSQPLKLNPLFPSGRPRGRTFRLNMKTRARIAIGGFQINSQMERRRI